MSFPTGQLSFRRFKIIGAAPSAITEEILSQLAALMIEPQEFGLPDEIEYGWSGGQHILDEQFTFDRNVFADCLHFALRLDTNRVPAESMALSGVKLPAIEEADDARAVFESRIDLIRRLCAALTDIYKLFLTRRLSSSWESDTAAIRSWIFAPRPA